jgi:hypothetical protein
MGDGIGADTEIVIREALLVALMVFPERVELLVRGWMAHGLVPSWCASGNVRVHQQASRTLGNRSNGANKAILTILLSMSARSDPRQSRL